MEGELGTVCGPRPRGGEKHRLTCSDGVVRDSGTRIADHGPSRSILHPGELTEACQNGGLSASEWRPGVAPAGRTGADTARPVEGRPGGACGPLPRAARTPNNGTGQQHEQSHTRQCHDGCSDSTRCERMARRKSRRCAERIARWRTVRSSAPHCGECHGHTTKRHHPTCCIQRRSSMAQRTTISIH